MGLMAMAQPSIFRRGLMVSIGVLLHFSSLSHGAAAGQNPAPFLTNLTHARAQALAGALSAIPSDATAVVANPAALGGIEKGLFSFSYQRGALSDSNGNFFLGLPTRAGSFGVGAAAYSSGEFQFNEAGGGTRVATAREDMKADLVYGLRLGSVSLGAKGTYLSSQLLETYKATTWAYDAGMIMALNPRVSLGAAIQNMGDDLVFDQEGDSLPRLGRIGMARISRFQSGLLQLSAEGLYFLNEKEWEPAAGIEWTWFPIAIRGGYQRRTGENEFSVGLGFALGSTSLDYSFGLAADLEDRHQATVSFAFGQSPSQGVELAKKPTLLNKRDQQTLAGYSPTKERTLVKVQKNKGPEFSERKSRRVVSLENKRTVYEIKSGDTLSKIAERHYGRSDMWTKIYQANKHLIDDPKRVKLGQVIVLP